MSAITGLKNDAARRTDWKNASSPSRRTSSRKITSAIPTERRLVMRNALMRAPRRRYGCSSSGVVDDMRPGVIARSRLVEQRPGRNPCADGHIRVVGRRPLGPAGVVLAEPLGQEQAEVRAAGVDGGAF